jgi:hypothetical protein
MQEECGEVLVNKTKPEGSGAKMEKSQVSVNGRSVTKLSNCAKPVQGKMPAAAPSSPRALKIHHASV